MASVETVRPVDDRERFGCDPSDDVLQGEFVDPSDRGEPSPSGRPGESSSLLSFREVVQFGRPDQIEHLIERTIETTFEIGSSVTVSIAERQRRGQLGGTVAEQTFDDLLIRDADDTDREMQGRVGCRGGAVSGRPRHVHDVARVHVDVAEAVDPPAFGSVELHGEHIVEVRVFAEPRRRGWGEVGVGLHWVGDLVLELSDEARNGRPGAVQRLQHQGRTVGESRDHLERIDDVVEITTTQTQARAEL